MPLDPYIVIKSKERSFQAVRSLRNMQLFLVFLFAAASIYWTIRTAHFAQSISSDALEFTALLSTLLTANAVLIQPVLIAACAVAALFAFLLTLALRKSWRWPVWVVAPLILLSTASTFALIAVMASELLNLLERSELQPIEVLSALIELYPLGTALAALFALVALVFLLVEADFSIRSLGEVLKRTSDSARYEDGLIIEEAKEADLPEVSEIYYSAEISMRPHLSKRAIMEEFSKLFEDDDTELRIARVPGKILGFTLSSDDFSELRYLCAPRGNDRYRAQERLVQDFVRKFAKSASLVTSVSVPSGNGAIEKVLLSNGWKASNRIPKRSTDILFEYAMSDTV